MLLKFIKELKMHLKSITDTILIEKTITLVREERELLTSVLHHLREIDRRRLFSSLGYKSLFDFTVRHLGYPEDQAYRRISAMKLLQEIPEVEAKISQGEISLTHIGLAQSHFRQEKKIQKKDLSREQKLSVIKQIANKPVREAERITLSLCSAPETAKPDRVNLITDNLIELKFTASKELQDKVERLKGLLAHSNPGISLGELFEKLCDLGLQELDPSNTAAPRKRRVKPQSSIEAKPLNSKEPTETSSQNPQKQIQIFEPKSKAQIRRDVFVRANNQCENCGSSYALEVDHIIPRALGGNSDPKNLRLLCRSCNQRSAIQVFGIEKMDCFIN